MKVRKIRNAFTSLILYPLLLGAPLPLGALRMRVVCLWVNPALPVSFETIASGYS